MACKAARLLVKLLAADLAVTLPSARPDAGPEPRAANRIVAGIRERIAAAVEEDSPVKGETKVDGGGFSLAGLGGKEHVRVQHVESGFATKACHIKGIEAFRACPDLAGVLQGSGKAPIPRHLKACEFRFTHREEEPCQGIRQMLRETPPVLAKSLKADEVFTAHTRRT